jgi:hypothetical protein
MVKEAYTGGKEDAYMAYMLAASITNVLSKKFMRMLTIYNKARTESR